MTAANKVRRHQRRFETLRRVPLVAALLAVALIATTIGPVSAQQNDVVRSRDTQTDVVRDAVRDVEQLRLVCAPDVIGDQRGVSCKWSATNHHTARGYQLYRIENGSARQLLTTVGADGRLAYFDTDVSAPSQLIYGVVALNHVGRVIGVGGPVRVQLGDRIEELRLACAPDSIGGRRGVLCRWSEASSPHTRGYLLHRAVGSDAREVVARIGLDGRTAYFDRDITPGAIHIYHVTAVDGAGTVVATGGPVRVQWPDVQPVD